MKRLGVVLVLAMFNYSGTVHAQVDSAPEIRRSETSEVSKKPQAQQSPVQSNAHKKEDREPIEIDQIPDLVRLTLEQGKQYRGWHNAKIFVDRAANEYILNITDSAETTRTFRFNDQGEDLSRELQAAEKTKRRKKPTRG